MAIQVCYEEAPARWASYLVNGDCSGIDDDEVAACDAWHEEQSAEGWYVVSTDDAEDEYIGWFARKQCQLVRYVMHRAPPAEPCSCDVPSARYCYAHGPFPR